MNSHLLGAMPGHCFSRRLQREYELMSFISDGTYGEVWKAVRKVADTALIGRGSAHEIEHPFYAVKKLKPLPAKTSANKTEESSSTDAPNTNAQNPLLGVSMATLREIKLLKEIGRHPNIIALVDVVIDLESEGVALVYEFEEQTLKTLIARYKSTGIGHHCSRRSMPRRVLESVMRQLTKGLAFLHGNWVVHRDIKPKNILLSRSEGELPGVLKIADFGMARIFKPPAKAMAKTESEVVTLLYRAPELLMGAHKYGPAVDVWAAGCVFAECILGHPLFGAKASLYEGKPTPGVASSASAANHEATRHPGGAPKHTFHAGQCDTIFRMLKAPTPATWPGVERTRHWSKVQRWSTSKPFQRNRLAKVLDTPETSSALDLLSHMLELDPTQRVTAMAALSHRFLRRSDPKKRRMRNTSQIDLKRQKLVTNISLR